MAGRLHGELVRSFGRRSIFRDKAGILPGQPWRKRILEEVRRSDVLLVLIDDGWAARLSTEAEEGSAEDWVQLEIIAAFEAGVQVLPVLVDGASMPPEEALPDAIGKIRDYQALALTDDSFEDDFRKLRSRLLEVEPKPAKGYRLLGRTWTFSKRAVAAWLIPAISLVAASLAILDRIESDEAEQMDGRFNIAVAEIEPAAATVSDADPESTADRVGNAIAAGLTGQRSDNPESTTTVTDVKSVVVWGPSRVGPVDADGVEELASTINAHMLVHGQMTNSGFRRYAVTIRVHTDRHNERAPWPLDIADSLMLEFPEQDVIDGAVDDELAALALTLDGLASLLADNLRLADSRFQQVDELLTGHGVDDDELEVSGRRILSTALALQSWALLVEAGFEGRSELVDRAARLAGRAATLDPGSELAEVVSFSADYMTIIPPVSVANLSCTRTATPGRPDEAAALDLQSRIESFQATATPVGEIQAMSFLGRLSVVRFRLDRTPADLAQARAYFEEILVRTGDDQELRFWRSDAYRFLGAISLVEGRSIEDATEDLIEAARIDTPVWAAKDLASAGMLHWCQPNGSEIDAVCLLTEASLLAQGPDREAMKRAADEASEEFELACPADWEL